MKIEIELDIEKVEPNRLVLSDNGFVSAEKWINLKFVNFLGIEENLGDVRLNDIFPAFISFDAKKITP